MTTTTTTKKQTTTTKTTTTTTTTRRKKKESSTYSSSFLRRQIILPISDVFVAIKSMNVRQLTLQLLSLTLIVTSALMIWKSLCLYTHSESPVVVVLSGSMEPAFKRGDILFLSLKKIKEEDIEEEERKTRVGEIIVFSIDGREIPIVHRVIKSHFHPFVSPPSSSSSSSSSSSLPTTIKTTKKESGENEKDQGRGGNNSGEDGLSSTRSDGSGSSEGDDDDNNNNSNNSNNNNSSEEETSSSSSSSSESSLFKHEMLTKGDNNYMDDIGLYAPGQKWLNEKHVMGRTVGYLPHVGKATILMNDHPMIKYALIFILGLLVISGKEG
jgi:signal peptidase I